MKLRRQRKTPRRPPQSNNRQRTPAPGNPGNPGNPDPGNPGNPGNSGNPDPGNHLLPHSPLQSRLPQQQLSL